MTDLEKAAEMLAVMYVDRQGRAPTIMEKQATTGSDWMGALGRYVQDNPVLGKALVGGGLGALAGGAAGALGGEDDPRGRGKRMMSHALMGGLSGAALGGGIGAAQKYMSGPPAPKPEMTGPPEPSLGGLLHENIGKPVSDFMHKNLGIQPSAPKPTEPKGTLIPGASAGTKVDFRHLTDEQRKNLIRETEERSKPTTAQQVTKGTGVARDVGDWLKENMPWTTRIVPGVLGADAAKMYTDRQGWTGGKANLEAGLGEKAILPEIKGSPQEAALKETMRSPAATGRLLERTNPATAGVAGTLGRFLKNEANEPIRPPPLNQPKTNTGLDELVGGRTGSALNRGNVRDVLAAGARAKGGGLSPTARAMGYLAPPAIDAFNYLIGAQQSAAERAQQNKDFYKREYGLEVK